MISVEELLNPISADQPCGPDLAYDPSFQELETMVQGKPETQFSAAEDPDWKALRDLSVAFLGKSKHLTASVILTLSVLKLEGLPGFRDGLVLTRGLLEKYWDNIYPALDPEDNNDPTERMNILGNLASPGDPYRFIPRLQETPIAQSPSLGRVRLHDVLMAKQPAATGSEPQPAALSESQIQAIFKDTNVDTLKGVHEAVTQSIECVKNIDAFLSEKVGTRAANLEELVRSLKWIQNAVAPYVGAPAADGGAEGADQAATATATGGASGSKPVAVPGAINSRDDVVRMIDRICEYYQKNEPSSPVPLILFRAQRIAKMSFMEIVNDLTPDAVTTVRGVTGPQPGDSTT